MTNHLFSYKWTLNDLFNKRIGLVNNEYKVFSCFACGGGSSMGYKLAGYNVLGYCEIDKNASSCYDLNLRPSYKFNEDIKSFLMRNDLSDELYDLDILDGSPPCSVFSMAGGREKNWGKLKKFREGQKEQILDDLFFDFISVADKLKPKIIIAENVKGILMGNAQRYVQKIYSKLVKIGYVCNHYLLNAMFMGVPQARERVFFVALREDLIFDKIVKKCFFYHKLNLQLKFNEKFIPLKNFIVASAIKELKYSSKRFGDYIINLNNVCPTQTTCSRFFLNNTQQLKDEDLILIQTFPIDYDFIKKSNVKYILGMSVPPVMMAQIANQVKIQILDKIKK